MVFRWGEVNLIQVASPLACPQRSEPPVRVPTPVLSVVCLSLIAPCVIISQGHRSEAHQRPVASHPVAMSATYFVRPLSPEADRSFYREPIAKPHPVQRKPHHLHHHPVPHQPIAPTTSDAYSWAHSAYAVRVSNCESGGGPSDPSPTYDGNPQAVNGSYQGKWQMDYSFWTTYGGLRYASGPTLASESAQDQVAYNGWRARGWEPWQCASEV